MRILGLDVGDRRIGVALSDPEGILAQALTVLERKSEAADIEVLASLVEKYEVEGIVVGMPLSLDSSIGKQAEKVLSFSKKLSQRVAIPVETWDERLSTVATERLLRDANMKRGERKKHRDAIAAAIILQGYLERLRSEDSGR
jgi:putative Holliday junction resolvase